MKLVLLLCLSFVPWSHGHGHPAGGIVHPEETQPQPQKSSQPNCDNMESVRAAHERERMQIPTGDKFTEFDWRLSKELNEVEKGNVVTSPVSLKVVLAMLYEGARGKTAQEIGEALDIQDATVEQRRQSRERFSMILKSLQTSEGDYKIKMGTHAFIDQTAEVNMNYQCKLKTYYNSDIVKVDFSNSSAAIKVINNWAKKVTEGHIQDLISDSEAQSSTIMLLLNAVYFKGQWEVPFPVNQTKPGIFHLDDQKTVKVPFMNVSDKFAYRNLPDIRAHMIELPYKGNKFAMYVILPYNNTSLDAITKSLGPKKSLKGAISSMMSTNINLIMPKFEFDFTTKLRSTLEKLGMKSMFSSEAELVDIAKTKSSGLVVSNVLQKAGISVTEAGTVAYAATSVDLVDKFGGSEETVDFVVDRPFLFFIEDTTLKTTVFVGKVINPDNAKVVSTPQETPAEPTGGSETDNRIREDEQPGNKVTTEQPETKEPTTQSRFNFFDGDLLQAVSRDVQGNFVISPASVKTLLGLILEAADERTLQEIKGLLRLPKNSVHAREVMGNLRAVLQNMNTSQVEVDSEAIAFLAKDLTINSTYEKVILDLYKARVTNVDFRSPDNAANKINSWVRTQTRGKITSLIDPEKVDPETMTILVTTVYFDGKWKEEFQLKDTKEECFYSEPNLSCNKVHIMYKKDKLRYKLDTDFNSHVVQIPYKDERFSMVLVVPATKDGTQRITRDINKLTFPKLLHGAMPTDVHLKLPRFSVEYETDLKLTLTKLGLNTAFSDEAKLPFMINNKQGRVSAVIHKAKIEVNEKGSKAAAASGAVVVPLMSGNDEVLVIADHPFYYFIYEEESRSVLFSGRISSLAGEAGTEENLLGAGGATPLTQNGFVKPSASVANGGPPSAGGAIPPSAESFSPSRKPSYSSVASGGPASSPHLQSKPSRQPCSPSAPTNNGAQYSGCKIESYNLGTTKSPQPQHSSTIDEDAITFQDSDHEATVPKFLEQSKTRNTYLFQRRTSIHH